MREDTSALSLQAEVTKFEESSETVSEKLRLVFKDFRHFKALKLKTVPKAGYVCYTYHQY